MAGRWFDYAVLALGVAAVSTAAVLIREADAPALVVAAYRLSFASLPLVLYAAASRRSSMPRGRGAASLALLSGVFLALHFAFWVASVKQTSVVTSTVLVTAAPLFVGLASGPFLGEAPSSQVWTGVAFAAAGTAVMVSEDFGSGRDTLEGDLFALLGAVFAAAYLMSGRRLLSDGAGWLRYISVTYPTSAAVLVCLAVLSGEALFDYSARTFAFLALLAAVPQLIGHTAVNRSLGHLPAIAVALAVQGEPVGATLLAAAVLGEQPTLLQVAGGLLVLAGVYVGIRPRPEAVVAGRPGVA